MPNYDTTSIVTLVNVPVYEQLLIEAEYDIAETRFLVDGFKNGFSLEYRGPRERQIFSQNLPFRCGSLQELRDNMIHG